MCFHPMRVKLRRLPGSSEFDPAAVSGTFVPCGTCAECRRSKAMAWSWRLHAEFEALRLRKDCRWSFAFVTLTYGTEKGGFPCDMLPFIPRSLFNDGAEFRRLPCFNKSHCQDYIKALRKHLHKKYWIGRKTAPRKVCSTQRDFKFYLDSNIRYFLASEFGGKKGRPHYHMILAYPLINGLTDEVMFGLCRKFWNGFVDEGGVKHEGHGFMFPKNFCGGNNAGREEKPFNVDISTLGKSLNYVSKYVCKDLEFVSRLAKAPIRKDVKDFRNYDCFHLQSRSLGLSVLSNLSDSAKMDLFVKGKAFIDQLQKGYQPIPIYIRDKILFDNQYSYERCKVPVRYDDFYDENGVCHRKFINIEDGYKRVVRKKASEFFVKHYKEVFEKQKKFYESLFVQMQKENFWLEKMVEKSFAVRLAASCVELSRRVSPSDIAVHYLSLYKRLRPLRVGVAPELLFLSRYDDSACDWIRFNNVVSLDFERYARYLDNVCSCYLSTLRFIRVETSDNEKDFEELSHLIKEVSLHVI